MPGSALKIFLLKVSCSCKIPAHVTIDLQTCTCMRAPGCGPVHKLDRKRELTNSSAESGPPWPQDLARLPPSRTDRLSAARTPAESLKWDHLSHTL